LTNSVLSNSAGRREDNQTKPTMRQKARFILRSRGHSEADAKAPEDAVSVVDELVASLVRSVYQKRSLTTHVASVRGKVKQLKMYVDTVLAELLEVHGAPMTRSEKGDGEKGDRGN
jgi:hypothetical protein